MMTKLKLFVLAAVVLLLSACASTPKLNPELIQQQPIQTINLNKMGQNIDIQAANNAVASAAVGGVIGVLVGRAVDSNTNARRRKSLTPFVELVDVMSADMIFINALEHNVEGGQAFAQNITIDTDYDQEIKKPLLTPILTPNVAMNVDYSGVTVSLAASIFQQVGDKRPTRYSSSYTSEQLLGDELVGSREENQQYWMDNPVELRKKIFDGLYDIAEQFARDYNTAVN